MKLYQKDGYFNAESVIEDSSVFKFVTGARGTGKTYGCLKYLISKGKTFIYLRRTEEESKLQRKYESSSLSKNIDDMEIDFNFGSLSGKVGYITAGKAVIYTCALSTFSKIRGVNFDNVDYILYDEFIPETHVRSIKGEGLALMNIFETVNRNRELSGDEPVKMICLSNSLNIANDVFMEFDLIRNAEDLLYSEEEFYRRGNLLLIIMKDSPISKKKENTALYQSSSKQFYEMAIKNKFVLNDFSYVVKKPLKEYVPVINVGDLYFYKHKSNIEWYVTFTKATLTKEKCFESSITGLERFKNTQWKYYERYIDGYIKFDSYEAIALFEKYFTK